MSARSIIMAAADATTTAISWTARTPGFTVDQMAYGAGLFVALHGNADDISTSPDAITWTTQTVFATPMNRVSFVNGRFIATAAGIAFARSTDGISWTAGTMPSSSIWTNVAWGNGVYVTMDTGLANAATSSDGITWALRALPLNISATRIVFGNGVFVAVGGNAQTLVSADGVTWTQGTLPFPGAVSITFGNGQFVAIRGSTTLAATSPDGITWTSRTLPASAAWTDVTFGDSVYVAVAAGPSTIAATSHSGFTWTQRALASSQSWQHVIYGNGIFLTSSTSATVCTSP